MSIPAGIVTSKLRCLTVRPPPRQVGQGFLITLPVALQLEQGATLEKAPKGVFCWRLTCPAPRQTEQVSADVPFAAPEPLHSEQLSFLEYLICFFTPNTASSKLIKIGFD